MRDSQSFEMVLIVRSLWRSSFLEQAVALLCFGLRCVVVSQAARGERRSISCANAVALFVVVVVAVVSISAFIIIVFVVCVLDHL